MLPIREKKRLPNKKFEFHKARLTGDAVNTVTSVVKVTIETDKYCAIITLHVESVTNYRDPSDTTGSKIRGADCFHIFSGSATVLPIRR